MPAAITALLLTLGFLLSPAGTASARVVVANEADTNSYDHGNRLTSRGYQGERPTLGCDSRTRPSERTILDTYGRVAFSSGIGVEEHSAPSSGNLSGDARWTNTWDNRNRLIKMETKSAMISAGAPNDVLEFTYDGGNRRVRKKFIRNGSTGYDEYYLYDGWNIIGRFRDWSGTKIPIQKYAWGLDASGTLHGAGGVGGLLWVESTTTRWFPAYDGNGNVMALLEDSDSGVTASYLNLFHEYGPFGESLSKRGVMDSFGHNCPFQFSTKWTDEETGLIYYGHRYYDPKHGRWLSRDPIGEAGGVNLYGFVGNDPVNRWDYLGLDFWIEESTSIEPAPHVSISVGKPEPGKYKSYSFGVNQIFDDSQFHNASLHGIVYEDVVKGGKIRSGSYYYTTSPYVDNMAIDALEKLVDLTGPYNPFSNCITFTTSMHEQLVRILASPKNVSPLGTPVPQDPENSEEGLFYLWAFQYPPPTNYIENHEGSVDTGALVSSRDATRPLGSSSSTLGGPSGNAVISSSSSSTAAKAGPLVVLSMAGLVSSSSASKSTRSCDDMCSNEDNQND